MILLSSLSIIDYLLHFLLLKIKMFYNFVNGFSANYYYFIILNSFKSATDFFLKLSPIKHAQFTTVMIQYYIDIIIKLNYLKFLLMIFCIRLKYHFDTFETCCIVIPVLLCIVAWKRL